MENTTAASGGTLSVAAGYANRAYPLPGVRVEIYGETDTGAPILLRSDTTNESGLISPLTVPTPPAADSLTPEDNGTAPFASFRIRLYKDGYTPVTVEGVPVFAGVTTLQYFDMIPIAKSAQYGK